MNKIKVLLGGIFFKNFTGSEMYLYELAKNLINLDCEVSIFSPNLGNPLLEKVNDLGIKCYDIYNLPSKTKFDIIHCQHQPVVKHLLSVYPKTPMICTIHSEVIDVENPIVNSNIKKYISIRESITDYIKGKFYIPENKIVTIFNPIDINRFNIDGTTDENFVLFVGSLENLRRKTVLDLCDYTKEIGKEFWLVGTNHSNYLQTIINEKHVRHFPATYNVETFVKRCSETSGILLGRTTIEGWICGKSGWIYDINNLGNIIDKKLHSPPNDLAKFRSDFVSEQIKSEYVKIIS